MDRRAKKAVLFFVACDANPDTRVKIPDAMRINGYSPSEAAADRLLQMQVRCEVDKIKGEGFFMISDEGGGRHGRHVVCERSR